MKKLRLILPFLALFALAAVQAFAEESGGGGIEKPGMEPWKWANFIILAGALVFMIRKVAGPAIAAKNARIADGLEAGRKASEEAALRAKAIEQKFAGLDRDLAALRDQAHQELQQEMARLRRDTESELARIDQHKAIEIETINKQARLEVRRYAAELALKLAEQKLRSGLTPEVQAGLVTRFAAELAAKAA